jgi:chemotaxis response regulator CheB
MDQPLTGVTVEGQTPSHDHPTTPSRVVAIGASAGGLEALQQLFGHMPPDTGMCSQFD